ncbi:hypothetical protein NFI96_020619 [Prochilodus magdalenae]|nr:hypothetical protein NFI96_020619 [Prochilodus magdalenae]
MCQLRLQCKWQYHDCFFNAEPKNASVSRRAVRETWPYRREQRRGGCDQALRTKLYPFLFLTHRQTRCPDMADLEQGSSSAALPTEGAPLQDSNGTDALNATAAKFVATAEGTALAYGSLVLMALLPIFFGALRSVSSSKSKVGSDLGLVRMSEAECHHSGWEINNKQPGFAVRTRLQSASYSALLLRLVLRMVTKNSSPCPIQSQLLLVLVEVLQVENSSDMPETITSRDAARFPIIASCTLFGLYLFFKIFSQEYINLLLSMYFFVLGILALSHMMSPFMNRVFPANLPNKQYQLLFTQGSGESKEEIVNYEFDTKDLICLGISSVVGVWYVLKKHWVANNLFGLAFALNGVELLHLNNVSTGCILLGGLFVYDVFWVFGTNVMVTVAKSFEAPIKLVFPQDLLERGLDASNFAMLGLGDIVIPGIFIALLLRFDVSLKNNSRTYFYTSFLAYIFGLGLTIFVMHTFKHAQPALLYLVPACIGFPVVVALVKGELTEMFSVCGPSFRIPHLKKGENLEATVEPLQEMMKRKEKEERRGEEKRREEKRREEKRREEKRRKEKRREEKREEKRIEENRREQERGREENRTEQKRAGEGKRREENRTEQNRREQERRREEKRREEKRGEEKRREEKRREEKGGEGRRREEKRREEKRREEKRREEKGGEGKRRKEHVTVLTDGRSGRPNDLSILLLQDRFKAYFHGNRKSDRERERERETEREREKNGKEKDRMLMLRLEHPHTVPADGAVGVEVE